MIAALTLSLFACAPDTGRPAESSSDAQSSPEELSPAESTPEESTPTASTPEASESESEPETDPPKSPITLNIGSYNIANGLNFKRITSIGTDIKNQNLDIVGVQEVDQFVDRTGRVDSMKMLSDASGLPYYAFFKAIDLQGGEYGVGILSKYPIAETDKI